MGVGDSTRPAFDLDGTLVDSHRDIADATNAVIADGEGGSSLTNAGEQRVGLGSAFALRTTVDNLRVMRRRNRYSPDVEDVVAPNPPRVSLKCFLE